MRQCWDESRRLVADTPAKKSFSQHANALAVLAGAIEGEAAADLMRRVAADTSLVPCSTCFRFNRSRGGNPALDLRDHSNCFLNSANCR